MTILYNILLHALLLLLAPVWGLLLLFNPRYRKGLSERLGLGASRKRSQSPTLWIHASSLGEVKVSAPICEALSQSFPDYEVVFTASTPVGKKQAREMLKGVRSMSLLPLDIPEVVCPVARRFQPGFLLVAETEFWPNLFFCMNRRNIPVALFNGRISDRSFKRYRLFRFFFRRVLSCVNLFCVQTERDAARFQELGAAKERIHVTGNVKFDAPYAPLTHSEKEGLRATLRITGDPAWVAGSAHPEELATLAEAHQGLRNAHPNVKWIVIPRHLYDVEKFRSFLEDRGARVALWDGKTPVSEPWDILLVNALGQLIRLYQLGFAAFVGGSLAPIGGHNPLEPLRYGIPTFFGPRMENFREIRDIILREGVGREVSTAGELASALEELLEHPEKEREMKESCLRFFERYQGATRRSIQILEAWIREHAS